MAWICWIKAVSSRRLAATISNDRITSHSATLLSNQSVSMAFYSQHSISRNQQKLWQLRHKTEGQFLFMVNDSNGIVRTKNFSSQPFLIDYAAAHKIQRALLYYRSIACFCPGSSLSKKHFVFVSSSLFFKGRWHDIRSRQKMNHLRLTAVSLECYFDLLLSHRNGRTTLPPCLRKRITNRAWMQRASTIGAWARILKSGSPSIKHSFLIARVSLRILAK